MMPLSFVAVADGGPFTSSYYAAACADAAAAVSLDFRKLLLELLVKLLKNPLFFSSSGLGRRFRGM